jgi:hypothetical protein
LAPNLQRERRLQKKLELNNVGDGPHQKGAEFMRLKTFLLVLCSISLSSYAELSIPDKMTHETTVSPNQTITETIPIRNKGDKPITVKVTPSDYLYSEKEGTDFPVVGTCSRSNGKWITSSKTSFEVPPKSTVPFTYTIQVPDDPTLEGTYWSVFLIEPVIKPGEIDQDKKTAVGVHTVMRYGVQIINNIKGTGKTDLKISQNTMSYEQSRNLFMVSVENPGSLSISPDFSVELFDEQGKSSGRFSGGKKRILPNCEVQYMVDLTKAEKGKYKAIALFDSGTEELFGSQFDIEVK